MSNEVHEETEPKKQWVIVVRKTSEYIDTYHIGHDSLAEAEEAIKSETWRAFLRPTKRKVVKDEIKIIESGELDAEDN